MFVHLTEGLRQGLSVVEIPVDVMQCLMEAYEKTDGRIFEKQPQRACLSCLGEPTQGVDEGGTSDEVGMPVEAFRHLPCRFQNGGGAVSGERYKVSGGVEPEFEIVG